MDKYWLEDYSILYKNNNFTKFVPLTEMTKIEQLNALTRFSIYSFILLILFEKDNRWLYSSIFLFILSVVLYKIHSFNLEEIKKELEKGDIEKDYNIVNVTEDKELIEDKKILDDYDKEIVLKKEETCTKPTRNNPFMNFLVSDYMDNPNKPIACSKILSNEQNREKMDNDINLNFEHNLYRDVDDLFNKKNSQRQFYTMPVTRNPNDQKSFAEWLYKIPETCKTDQSYCLRYEDLRYKRI
jgi:hypothetical protein